MGLGPSRHKTQTPTILKKVKDEVEDEIKKLTKNGLDVSDVKNHITLTDIYRLIDKLIKYFKNTKYEGNKNYTNETPDNKKKILISTLLTTQLPTQVNRGNKYENILK
ncbi:MAG: hypothetical protein EBU66_19765, partial [Bacteroidetes bacterium]|nr:hypothetical protein [Bacteroidota bacterium]